MTKFGKLMSVVLTVLIASATVVGISYALKRCCVAVEEKINLEEVKGPVVGGDRDEHGCIGSAGYSWCENKQKCLRSWEEECFFSTEDGIKYAFSEKYKKNTDEVKLDIIKETANHAFGGVKFGEGPTGGMFLAVKFNGIWNLVYDGNGSADCEKLIEEFQFPRDMLTNFCD